MGSTETKGPTGTNGPTGTKGPTGTNGVNSHQIVPLCIHHALILTYHSHIIYSPGMLKFGPFAHNGADYRVAPIARKLIFFVL